MIEQIRGAWAICKKDMRIYFLKAPVLIYGILLPLFLFFAFCIGRTLPLIFLLPGLVGMTLFFTSTAVVQLIAPWETRSKTLERLISSPVSISAIITGDILASFLFGIIISVVPVLVGVFGGVSIQFLVLIPGVLIASFCFSSLGALISTPPTDNPSNIMMLSTLIKFSTIFISGIFIPLKDMPYWGKIVASVSPLTYLTDLVRYCVHQSNYFPIYINFLFLLIFSVVFYLSAVKLHQHTMPRRI